MNGQGDEALRHVLGQVLNDSAVKAVAIVGDWGVGKTHRVQNFFGEHSIRKDLKTLALGYAYVSLFGASSLDDIRRRLCTSALSNSEAVLTKALGKAKGLKHARVDLGPLGGIDLSAAGEVANQVVESRVLRRLVVCIDDLERTSMPVGEILGLVSELAERCECRCVLLFNASRLAEPARDLLTLSEEKVFDFRFEFRPTVTENLKYSGIEPGDIAHVGPVFCAFQVANIRVMRRAGWLLRRLRPLYSGKQWDRVAKDAAVLAILRHAFPEQVGDLRKFVQPGLFGRIIFGSREPAPIAGALREPLLKTGFLETDYTEGIIELMDTGYTPPAKLKDSFKAAELAVTAKRFNAQVDGIVGHLLGGLHGTASELADRIIGIVKARPENAEANRVLQAVDWLLRLENSERAQQLVKEVLVAILQNVPAERRDQRLKSYDRLANPVLYSSIPYVPTTLPEQCAIEAINRASAFEDSWDPAAYAELAAFSDHAIAEALLQIDPRKGLRQISRLIERLAVNVPPELAISLLDRLHAILQGYARQDHLNQVRFDAILSHSFRETRAKFISDTESSRRLEVTAT